MPYEFLEDLTLADTAFVATGRSIEEMFSSAGEAVTATMIKDLKTVKQSIKKEIEITCDNVEELLFKFLEELIFLKDAELLIFSRFDVKIKKIKEKVSLTAMLYGDNLDAKRQEHLVDVKAVTMHMFEVKKTETGWYSRVILDI